MVLDPGVPEMNRTGSPDGSPPSRTVSVRPSEVTTDRIGRVYSAGFVETAVRGTHVRRA
jgi:hypothetical protein